MSLWASGTPCSGPRANPPAIATSAAAAVVKASSASTRTKALRRGCQRSIRASSERVTSTDDSLRSRIAAATPVSVSVLGSVTYLPLTGYNHVGRRLDLQRKRDLFGRETRHG